jgi:hypothetical protein
MKKLLFIALSIALTSCSVFRNFDTTGYTTEGNTVLYNGVPMAKLVGVEFAYDDKKLVKELTFTLLDGDYNDKIVNLLAYLNGRYAEYEIEIEIPIEKYKELK